MLREGFRAFASTELYPKNTLSYSRGAVLSVQTHLRLTAAEEACTGTAVLESVRFVQYLVRYLLIVGYVFVQVHLLWSASLLFAS